MLARASAFGLISLLFVLVVQTHGLCLGTTPPTCLESMTEEEVTEKLNYVLNKYEEVEMKLIGTPIGVYGNRITYGDREELNINFQYLDNTLQDIIQNCVFVLLKQPRECESISTICNTFLPITPRPLLVRETLSVCDDDDEDVETVEPVANQEQQPKQQATETDETRNDSEII